MICYKTKALSREMPSATQAKKNSAHSDLGRIQCSSFFFSVLLRLLVLGQSPLLISVEANFFVIIGIIIGQGNSERSDWFYLGRDFTIRTVSTETVQAVHFILFVSKAGNDAA